MFRTYPYTLLGVDKVRRFKSICTMAEKMHLDRLIPQSLVLCSRVDLLGVKRPRIPEGAGPPIYVGYNFYDEMAIDGGETLRGQGWKAGLPTGRSILSCSI